MKLKIIHLIEFTFYILGLYLCLVWAKLLSRPNWIQEDIEPIYGILGALGMIGTFVYRLNDSKSGSITKRLKNIVKGNRISVNGDFHVGDKGKKVPESQYEKNIVENNIIKSNKFHTGDK